MPKEFAPIVSAGQNEDLPIGDADSVTDDPLGNSRERGERGGTFVKTDGKFGGQKRRQAVFPGHHQHRRGREESGAVNPPQAARVEAKPVERDVFAEKLQQELKKALLAVPTKNKEFIPYAIEALTRALRGNSETFLIQAVLKGQMRIPDASKAALLLREITEAITTNEELQKYLSCGPIKPSFTAPCSMSVTIKRENTGE